MKKFFISLSIFILLFTIAVPVKAADTATISVSANKKSVIVGNNVSVTVTVSSANPIAALYYSIQYDSSILSLSSTTAPTGGAKNLDTIMNDSTYRKSYSYTFKAKKSGDVSISVIGVEVRDKYNSILTPKVSGTTIKCMTQAELEATYSKNNNLSGLGIEGYELSPSFNADTTEYTVELKPETESVNVIATKADSTASIVGSGEVAVSEGMNTIKIDVTAQNGNVKTYTIVANVKELDPINVKVNDKDYTVVRSKKALIFDNQLFTETTTLINGTDVPAFFNEITNTTIIGLKDSEGKITYFVVDGDKYIEYKELTLGNISIRIMTTDTVPYGYSKMNITINDKEYEAFKTKDTSRFALIYGDNLENGNIGFYVYDNLENTLQRYDDETANIIKNKITKFQVLTYILGTSTGLLFIGLIIALRSKIKQNKITQEKINKMKERVEGEKEPEVIDNNTKDLTELREDIEEIKEKKETSEMDNNPEDKDDLFDEMEKENVEEDKTEDIFDEMEEKQNKKKKHK